jgi:hypothetical protein
MGTEVNIAPVINLSEVYGMQSILVNGAIRM